MKGVISKQISGKTISFKFGMNFMFAICQSRGYDKFSELMEELANLNDEDEEGNQTFNEMRGFPVMRDILYFAAKNYCEEFGDPVDFNLLNAGSWIDSKDLGYEGAFEILQCFFDSLDVGKEVKEKLKKSPREVQKSQA